MKKNKVSLLLEDLKEVISFFQSKYLVVLVLLVLCTNLPSILAYYPIINFYDIFYSTLTYSFHFVILLLVILISVILLSSGYHSSIYYSRYKTYRDYLKAILKKNLLFVFFILFMSFLFNLLGSAIRSGFHFSVSYHPIYSIPMPLYLLFYLIREVLLVTLLTSVLFYVYNLTNRIVSLVIAFFIPILGLIHFHDSLINSITSLPLLVTDYFTAIQYANIFFEFSGTIFQFILFISFYLILDYFVINRRKDLV